MQDYGLTLVSEPSKSFRCQKAANSLDIDTSKKLTHTFQVRADIESDFNIGLIVGASGSGKTSLAKEIWGQDSLRLFLREDLPIIDQFPENLTYDTCVAMLSGVGLTSVPCWIRPAATLSNGQRARAEIALQMTKNDDEVIVIDEWTSVVDRTVAKVMSHCIQKFARKTHKSIVLLSCHYDVIEWLRPDWIIDCNKQRYVDRRRLRCERAEQLQFDLRQVGRETWPYFSKYHYLSDRLPAGYIETFGLFCGDDQIGFQCFANYVPDRTGKQRILHANRIVVHPDYCGFGLGMRMVNAASAVMAGRGYRVMCKFSSAPMLASMRRDDQWVFRSSDRLFKQQVGKVGRGFSMKRKNGRIGRAGGDNNRGFRLDVRTYSFEYVGASLTA